MALARNDCPETKIAQVLLGEWLWWRNHGCSMPPLRRRCRSITGNAGKFRRRKEMLFTADRRA
jgi:hypothetical protein